MDAKPGEHSGWVKRLITCGTIATAITGILGLCAFLWDRAKPVVQGPPTPAPTPTYNIFEGTLSDVSLEYGVNFSEYLQLSGQSEEGYTADHLQYPGVLANFTARISGFTGQPCRIGWSVYNSTSQELLYTSTFKLYGLDITSEKIFTPERDIDQASSWVWVATPGDPGEYFVRLELFDPEGVRLDYADSVVFYVP